jgi:hypothetical protein
MELNSMFGAQHTFVYDYKGGTSLKPYMEYYEREGRLTVLPFNLPNFTFINKDGMKYDWNIVWNYGQEVLIHDCLYRNMFVARRLVFVDMDEFIVPQRRGVLEWSDILRDSNCSDTTGLFMVRNAFFPVGIGGVNNHLALKWGLNTLFLDRRLPVLTEGYSRAKYIVVPEKILYLRIHCGDQYWDNVSHDCAIPVDVAIMQHYKMFPKELKTGAIYKHELIKDETIFKYTELLVKRAKQVHRQIGSTI